MRLLRHPHARLAIRALLVGAGVALQSVIASDDPTAAVVWKAALAAGAMAALEAFTPLNQLVGLFKTPPR